MELPFKPIRNILFNQVNEMIEPFLREPISNQQNQIMKLSDVEKILHQHFVNLQPLWITFEYYDRYQMINQVSELVFIESTINSNRQIIFSTVYSNERYEIHTEQILAVSANIAA